MPQKLSVKKKKKKTICENDLAEQNMQDSWYLRW